VSVFVSVDAGREKIVIFVVDVVSKVCVEIAKPPLSMVSVVLIVEVCASVVPGYAVSVYVDVDVKKPIVDVELSVLVRLFDQKASQELQHSSTLTLLGALPAERLVVRGGGVEAVGAVDVGGVVAETTEVDELPTLLVCHLIRERVVLNSSVSPPLFAVLASASLAAGL